MRLPEEEALRLLPADLTVGAVDGPGQRTVTGPAASVARFAQELTDRSGSDGLRRHLWNHASDTPRGHAKGPTGDAVRNAVHGLWSLITRRATPGPPSRNSASDFRPLPAMTLDFPCGQGLYATSGRSPTGTKPRWSALKPRLRLIHCAVFGQVRCFCAIHRQSASDIAEAPLYKRAGGGVLPSLEGRPVGGEAGRLLAINVAVLPAVIVVWRLRRRTEARSRVDERTTVVIVLALGVLIAPIPAGQGILNILGQLASGVTQASR